MADLASLANEVVTTLEELDSETKEVEEKFLTDGPKIIDMATDFKQQAEEVEKATTSLEERVKTARKSMSDRTSGLKEKLKKLTETANQYSETTQDGIQELRSSVAYYGSLEFLINEDSEFQALQAKIESKMDEANTVFAASNDVIEESIMDVTSLLPLQQESLEEIVVKINKTRDGMPEYIGKYVETIKKNTETFETAVDERSSNWLVKIGETNTLLATDLQSAVELLRSAENDSRNELQAVVEEAEGAYDGKSIEEASKQTQESAQNMCELMEQSEDSFDGLGDSISEVLGVLAKILESK